MTEQQSRVLKTIHLFSGICAGFAIQPIPFADIFILTPIQMGMGAKIAAIHGVPITDSEAKDIWKEIAGAIGLGIVAQHVAIGLYRTVLPFIGAATTIPLVYGLTFGIGKVMDAYFRAKAAGKTLTKEQIKDIYKSGEKEGKQEGRRKKTEINNGNAESFTDFQIKGTDHRVEMFEAVDSADSVILILSGWVSNFVLTETLVEKFANAAQRGVRIYIGYGWVDSTGTHRPSKSSELAEQTLKCLQNRFPARVFVGKYANHQKVLIKDSEYVIIGSNNWLSNAVFRNDEISIKSYNATAARDILDEEVRNIMKNRI